ncbi:sugar transferase [Candidatus Parcubacteria bacterium]|nr:sugar transferase [Candidatus Parcubacteria bacterium]
MKKADLVFNVLRLPLDFVMLVVAGITTYLFRTRILNTFRPVYFELNLPLVHYLLLVVVVATIFILAYAVSGLYSMKIRVSKTEELLRVFVASSAAIMFVIVYIFLRQELFNSRFLVLGAWLTGIVFVSIERLVLRYVQHVFVSRYDFGIQRVVLIGNDDFSRSMSENIIAKPSLGYRIVAQWEMPNIAELIALAEQGAVDEVLLASPFYAGNHITELVDTCHEHHIAFKFVPNLYQTLTKNVEVDTEHGVPLIELRRTRLEGWGRVFKRTLDATFSILGLIVLFPLFSLVALLIKLDSKGPVFVSLKRVSKNREFNLYKFRSMIDHAHDLNSQLRLVRNDRPDAGPLWKMKDDPRITKVGKIIRKYRIDELPQFWNVLKGDMSLVGPRPHQPDEISQYEKHHKKVLAIKAGATGLAQVSGSSDLPFDQEVAYDSFYIENWSLILDLKIIFKTVFKMLYDRSAA